MLNVAASVKKSVLTRYQPGLWVIILVGLLNSASFSVALPFLALYLSEQRGISAALIGLIMLIGIAVPSLPQLLGGSVADKIGRKPLLIMTACAGILGFVALAVSIGFSAPVVVIAVLYTFNRSAIVMQRPGLAAAVTDLVPQEQLSEAMALFRMGGNLGWAIGPAVGGFLAVYLNYAWLFGVSLLGTLLTLIIILGWVKETGVKESRRVSFINILSAGRDKNLLIMTVLSIFLCLLIANITSTLSIYTVEMVGFSSAQYGFLLTLNGLLVVVLQYPVIRIMRRFKDTLSLVLGSALFGLGYLVFSWVGSYRLALAAIALLTMGEIIFSPTAAAAVGKMAPSDCRGRYMAFFGSSETIGMAAGLYLGGFLLDSFAGRPLIIWGVIASSGFLAALGFAFYRIEKRIK